MIKLIQVSVDEFTLVLQPDIEVSSLEEWEFTANAMISEFIKLSRIEEVLGKLGKDDTKTNPSGYNTALHVLDKPYYLSIGYHTIYARMGVIIKLSSYSWCTYQAEYNNLYGEELTLSKFLHMIESSLYSYRLSRIDIAVDYKDYYEDHFLDSLYEALSNNNIKVVDSDNKTSYKTSSVIVKDNNINTIYLGSRKTNSRKFLRIYDKRLEQIDNNGFNLLEAKKCKFSWIRIEASFRDSYSHHITHILNTCNDYSTTLLSIFLDKYRFIDVQEDKYCPWTDDLIKLLDDPDKKILRIENPRDNSIARRIMHLINDSGLFSTMEKVRQIWGENSDLILFMFLLKVYKSQRKKLSTNREILAFVRKHFDLHNIDFRDYLKTVL